MMYTIKPIRTYFTRRGYAVQLFNDDGTAYTRLLRVEGTRNFIPDSGPVRFYGNDGRKVRAEAMTFVRSFNATAKTGDKP